MSIKKLTCREILEKLSEYIDQEIDPAVCEEIESHMAGCNPCIAFLNTLKKTVKLYNKAGEEVKVPEEARRRLHVFLREHCKG